MSLERILSFLRRVGEAVVDEVRPLDGATALLTPALPLVWELNAVRAESHDADAGQLVEAAEEALGHVSHRKLVVHDQEHGARLAPELSRSGWNVYRLLVMVRDRPPERGVEAGVGGEVDRATGARALAAFRREQPFGWQEEAVQQLAAMDDRYSRAAHVRDFAAPLGEPAAACRLYTGDGLGQVDEVGTLERRRRRGYASAAVTAAAEAAAADGCDPVFLLTDASDWPRHLYARLGFSPVGELYEFLKLPLSSGRP
jgi:ribosomal protein S18 acetylase RimI-like enzyme